MVDAGTGERSSRRLWIGAGIAALALHLGGAALAIAHLRAAELDDALGAPAIEIGLDMTSANAELSDLPPGPDAEASVASPALEEQKAEVKETDLPKDLPVETDEPDRVVTTSEVQKPVEDDARMAAVQTSASQEVAAAEATATPSLEAVPQGAKSVAPALGTGASARRIAASWQKELVAHLDRHKRYPADRSQKNAEMVVSFALDRMGHLLSAGIVKSSGDTVFDQAALAMLRRSDPVPRPPPVIADDGLSFTLPVIFRIKDKGSSRKG